MSIERRKYRLLDLYCGAGGASMGYARAGFTVVGVDIRPQPRYPFEFHQMSALDCTYEFLEQFDIIHASPPCQQYSVGSAVARKQGKVYPDLVSPTRLLLVASGKPYIMENVRPAPLRPHICLDGTMFSLGVIRPRVFETNIEGIPTYPCPSAIEGTVKDGDYVTVAGNGGRGSKKGADWSTAMGIDWMKRNELKESIPPAYTQWIGIEALLRLVTGTTLRDISQAIAAANPRLMDVPKTGIAIPIRLPGF
jgi:DNA (cytosine-5)-methyltransferase 1